MKEYYVYLLTNQNRTVLYVGVTNDLKRRVGEHKAGAHPGFTKKYNVHSLVYFETYPDVNAAIARGKQLKAGSRQKKLDLINSGNKDWNDLFEDL
ncbi:GIY-YIG nuclease family protein [Hymenobacter sp. NST-14]|uniref:GIY-YIG nuclease family protein n=1 Tax=Hymenobacter piscis TaxID=2839984 RepID=UPI001C02E00D|nr:GIY-YIG nuclease family protein [Hymenobacter piscis]MBT9395545.1 GIY-YIG nuclease family protein [Hymenobacter piscis]